MSVLKFLAPAVVLAAGIIFSSTASYAKKEYMVATKKACKYCHVDAMAKVPAKQKELTDAGKYYKAHNSLDGFVEKK